MTLSIIDKTGPGDHSSVRYSDVVTGQCFEYEQDIYLKTYDEDECRIVDMCLLGPSCDTSHAITVKCDEGEMVRKVSLTLEVKEIRYV